MLEGDVKNKKEHLNEHSRIENAYKFHRLLIYHNTICKGTIRIVLKLT